MPEQEAASPAASSSGNASHPAPVEERRQQSLTHADLSAIFAGAFELLEKRKPPRTVEEDDDDEASAGTPSLVEPPAKKTKASTPPKPKPRAKPTPATLARKVASLKKVQQTLSQSLQDLIDQLE